MTLASKTPLAPVIALLSALIVVAKVPVASLKVKAVSVILEFKVPLMPLNVALMLLIWVANAPLASITTAPEASILPAKNPERPRLPLAERTSILAAKAPLILLAVKFV